MAELAPTACPRCGNAATSFTPVEAGTRLALQATGEGSNIPPQVCTNCYTELVSKVSKGMQLRLESEAKEKNKLMLWKNRVNLIKQARSLMTQKAYSEAAVAYEKYLRVLEMVYSKKRGELSPEVFSNSKRSKELTVVASVYWDLFRIYDTSPRYGERMAQAGAKLALFLPFSPIFPDVIKKADAFSRSAKNPATVKSFLKACKAGRNGCFIATAVYGDPQNPDLQVLRDFRDEVLLHSTVGRTFTFFYYRHSPPIADWLTKNSWACQVLRPGFRLVAMTLENQRKFTKFIKHGNK